MQRLFGAWSGGAPPDPGLAPPRPAPPERRVRIVDLPERAQALLGYAVHDAIEDMGGYAGMVEMRDPLALLREGKL